MAWRKMSISDQSLGMVHVRGHPQGGYPHVEQPEPFASRITGFLESAYA